MPVLSDTLSPEIARRVIRIQTLTVAWRSAEAVVSSAAAWAAHSPALLTFGGGSAVELPSAAVVLHRVYRPSDDNEAQERASKNRGSLAVRPGGIRDFAVRRDAVGTRRAWAKPSWPC